MFKKPVVSRRISRRSMLAATAAVAATPAVAQECRLGPPPHHQGQPVFLAYDQLELDASYDQAYRRHERAAPYRQAARADHGGTDRSAELRTPGNGRVA